MGRPHKERIIEDLPPVTHYKPVGKSAGYSSEMILTVSEMEAIRLVDIEKLDQLKASEHMGVSSPTLNRIVKSAHQKIAFALWNGQAIRVEGGNFRLDKCRSCCYKNDCTMKDECEGGWFKNSRL